MKYELIVNSKNVDKFDVESGQVQSLYPQSSDSVIVQINNKNYLVERDPDHRDSKHMTLKIDGKKANIEIRDEVDVIIDQLGMEIAEQVVQGDILAPMPGKIIEIKVKPGDEVETGGSLLILEAMKMENILKSHGEGIIQKIHVSEGQTVEKGTLLISMD